MKKRILSAGVVLAALLGIWATAVSAQNVTGTILGTVSDAKGGVVANATVTITNSDQRIVVRTVSTDEHGQYVLPLLPVGRYIVTVEIAGFKKAVQSGIVLNVDDRIAVNFSLEVGSVNESVSV